MKDDRYALIPVTIENAPPHIPYGGRKIGKGNQLLVDANDFPTLARPLFHIWNLILKEYELGRVGRYWKNVPYVLYHGRRVRFGEVHPTRGFQESIFNDEIQGAFDISLFRELDAAERTFLRRRYPNLSKAKTDELIKRLSHIRTGGMEPCYVMRYGFYEGHTTYRVDPIAIAFLFGLRSIEEIEAAFPGELYETLTRHFPASPQDQGN